METLGARNTVAWDPALSAAVLEMGAASFERPLLRTNARVILVAAAMRPLLTTTSLADGCFGILHLRPKAVSKTHPTLL